MILLKSKDLLLISPHLRVFIKDQAKLIRPFFNNVSVIMPFPHFSKIASLPYFKEYFSFLRLAEESRLEPERNFSIYSPGFFTLPLEALRKRNCFLAAKSSVKTLTKNDVNFDLIHAHFLDYGFIGAAVKSLFNKPLVVTAHGGDVYNLPFLDKWHKNLAKYVLSEADQVITVSRFNAEKLLSLGVSRNKLHVIPNGYDENLFKPISSLEIRRKIGLPPWKKVLLSVGNLVDVKGYTHLIDAMQIVLKKRDDVILVIVGSGSSEEVLQKKVRELSLGNKVLFMGRKEHEEIPMWMNASDLFVLPSLSEGFPTVIPEAMACGKPVIASCVGGIPEAISSVELGILVPPKDHEALSRAILEALDKKWATETIVRHAKRYTWGNLVKEIIAVYREVSPDP